MIWFDAAELRLRAGRTWYARGLDHVDKVRELCWSPEEVTATVRGTDVYRVRLWNDGGDLTGACSCPWGKKGNFCNHCAAFGLAALAAAGQHPAAAPAASEPGPVVLAGIRAYLSVMDHAELVELLVELANSEPAVHQRLSLRAEVGVVGSAEPVQQLDPGLSDPGRCLRLAETLRGAGRIDDAIACLRRGLSNRPWGHGRITDLLVELYTETGQLTEAAVVRWDTFASDPDEYNYRMLLRAAEPMNAVEYAKDRAMSHLRERADRKVLRSADALVTILIAIGDIDEAWAAAHQYTCSDRCMFLLARHRARTHPADAIPFFVKEVDIAIGHHDRTGYAKATELLIALKELHQRAGTSFATYLATIKATHRRKTALMRSIADAPLIQVFVCATLPVNGATRFLLPHRGGTNGIAHRSTGRPPPVTSSGQAASSTIDIALANEPGAAERRHCGRGFARRRHDICDVIVDPGRQRKDELVRRIGRWLLN